MLLIVLAACAAPSSAAVLTIENLTDEGVTGLFSGSGSGVSDAGSDAPGTGCIRPDSGTADPFAEIDENLGPADAAALKARIRNMLYTFSYDEAEDSWYARNIDTRITFAYTDNGTARFSGSGSSFGLALDGVGREGTMSPVSPGKVEADGRHLDIARPGFTEWYRNNDAGLEQGLTIADRPEGTGPVLVRFAISGDCRFTPGYGSELAVTDAAGNALFTYTGLHATDATGTELTASLATDGTTLSWVVDDTGAAYPVTIDPVVVPASTANATFTGAAAGDTFGYSVALSSDGSRVLVGAYYNNSAGIIAGAAYLFEEPAGGWNGSTSASAANATFTGSAAGDKFGYSVALSSDGSRVLVGAYTNSEAGINAGAAYLFEEPAGGWNGSTSASAANATFTSAAPGDTFGISVALSSNGSLVLAGAPNNDTAALNAGAAYLFEEPAGGWSGSTSASAANATFTGSAAGDTFGISVALSSDGSLVLAGAYGNNAVGSNAGAAYLFEEPPGGWSGSAPASAANATFTGATADDQFGNSVALSLDGSRVLAGAFTNDEAGIFAGAAYLFEEPVTGWTGTTSALAANATFTGSAAGDIFGKSVALSSDGSQVFVGAYGNATAGPNAGAAYLFGGTYTATLTAGGTTRGTAGTTVDGLTLNPSLRLTNIDLYLGTSATAVTGTPVKTGIANLPVSTATTVDDIDLSGKNAGTYYLIACNNGTTTVLGATASAAYTVTAAPVTTATTAPAGGTEASGSDSSGRDSSYTASSPGGSTGQPMIFAINEPLAGSTIWAIVTVTIVPAGDLGATQIVVTDNPGGSGPDDGRHVAGVFSIVAIAVNPSKIDSGTIIFGISKSWLDQYGLSPEDIVLLHNVNGVWEECPTTYGYESNGVYYFTATTPGFSYFAIASRAIGSAGTAEIIPAADNVPDNAIESIGEDAGASGQAASSSAWAASQPSAAGTTAAPATASAPAGGAGFPFITAALIGAGCIVLAGSGWWVRRWWIRRQNPVLYADCDCP